MDFLGRFSLSWAVLLFSLAYNIQNIFAILLKGVRLLTSCLDVGSICTGSIVDRRMLALVLIILFSSTRLARSKRSHSRGRLDQTEAHQSLEHIESS